MVCKSVGCTPKCPSSATWARLCLIHFDHTLSSIFFERFELRNPVSDTHCQIHLACSESKLVNMSSLGVTWQVDQLSFHPVSKLGKRFVNIIAPDVDRLRFQMSENQSTNLQRITWGLSAPQNPQLNDQNECEKFNLDLTVESDELKTLLHELDRKCEKEAMEHSVEWFGKKLDERDINLKFNPLLKRKDDGTCTVRVKVAGETAKVPTNVWVVSDSSGTQIKYFKGTLEHLTKDALCLVMVEASSIWFSKLFGISLNVLDIMVWPVDKKEGIFTLNLPGVKLVEAV